MFVAGIDENGLGPKLGPLIVTGALFETEAEDYEPGFFREALGGVAQAGGARVTDSKEVMSTRNMALGETTVLALASLLTGSIPDSVEAFLDLVCDPGPPELRSACPPGASGLCFGENEPLPVFGGSLATARAVSSTLEAGMAEAGVRLASVKSEVYCPARYNRWLAGEEASAGPGKGRSKADLDLHAFERRIRLFSQAAGKEGLYLCGKVMNLKYYSPKLSLVSRFPLLARAESREESSYRLQDLGRLSFVLDGDRIHPPVALASMFGKYVRELFMRRLNAYFAPRLPGAGPVSGYGDPLTRLFIRKARPVLVSEGIPEACFLRTR